MPKKKPAPEESKTEKEVVLGPRPRLKKLIIKNFRCIGRTPVEIDLDDIVVLVGPNNVGKSAILKAYEVVMNEGSKEGYLEIPDFPNGKVTPDALPEIELHTIVYDNSPGDEWIASTAEGEKLVREKWQWKQAGSPNRRGFNVQKNDWASEGDPETRPWGMANLANARRPIPHRVDAFASPDIQTEEIVKILKAIIMGRVKALQTDSTMGEGSDYTKLLDLIKDLQKKIVSESQAEIEKVQMELTNFIEKVFPEHRVIFDAKPEDDLDKTINLFRSDAQLLMGPKTGYLSTIDRQGSGARRTLLWTALRLIAENWGIKKADMQQRPHVLLLDEPEICLHPNAIREVRDLLYGIPGNTGNWQVMVTTHSPCFVDFTRDHTTIVRVEKKSDGDIIGTTIFRPSRANFSDDDKEELKLLNMCDPYVAEFFFGGKTIVVEGDTEYTAFHTVMAMKPDEYRDVHIVRARGKATIVALSKILNQFGSTYAILHDTDMPYITDKDGNQQKNTAWAHNRAIQEETREAKASVRLVASLTNFETAYLNTQKTSEKPYYALVQIRKEGEAYETIKQLLDALIDFSKPLPSGAIEWKNIDELESRVNKKPPI